MSTPNDTRLPDGWKQVRFGDVVRNAKDTTRNPEADGLQRVVGLTHLDSNSFAVRRWDTLDESTSFTRIFRAGQVLFGKRRAYQRKVGVPNFPGICSGDILVFESKSPELLPEFLPHIVQSDAFFERAIGTSAGSLSPRTKWQDLANYRFALPPRDEQQRIVELLTAAVEVREAHVMVAETLQAAQESMASAMMNDDAIATAPLGQMAVVASGASWSRADESREPREGAMPVIGIGSLQADGSIVREEPVYVGATALGRSPFVVEDGDVLAIRTNGNAERIGQVYLASEDATGCVLSSFTFGIRFASKEQGLLAFEYMSSARFQSWATGLVAGSTGLKNLSITMLRTALMPVEAGECSTSWLERLLRGRRAIDRAREAAEAAATLTTALREKLLIGGSGVH